MTSNQVTGIAALSSEVGRAPAAEDLSEPAFPDSGEACEPPQHISIVRLKDILPGIEDAVLRQWPNALATAELERRERTKLDQ